MRIGMPELRALRAFAKSNTILDHELNALDGFDTNCELAQRARALRDTVTAPEPAPWPTTAAEVTDTWLDAATTFDAASADAQARRDLLSRVAATAEQQAFNVAELAGTAILQNLHTRLLDTLEKVRNLKGLSGVTTAADAIVKDHTESTGRTSVDAWQTLTELSATYENIRDAQQKIMTLFFSEHLARYGSKTSPDPLASELHAQNLDAVWAPNWRDRTDTPWPADPVEKLLWLARSNAQPWVPTPGQLKRATRERIEEARTAPSQPGTPALAQIRKPRQSFGIYA